MPIFQIWKADSSSSMFEKNSLNHVWQIHEKDARLVLEFETSDTEQAKLVYDNFLFAGNPDGLTSLNIPGSDFYITDYESGFSVGDLLKLKSDYFFEDEPKRLRFPSGTIFKVVEGDILFPNLICMRVKSNAGKKRINLLAWFEFDSKFNRLFEKQG